MNAIPKGVVMLLKQLLPDFDAEKLAEQLTRAQQELPVFISALQAKIASIDDRLLRLELALKFVLDKEYGEMGAVKQLGENHDAAGTVAS